MNEIHRAAEIADKYIARDGAAPASTEPKNLRLCCVSVDDLAIVARFLAWHESNDMFGGVKAAEAWLAFCRMTDLPAGEFRKVIRE